MAQRNNQPHKSNHIHTIAIILILIIASSFTLSGCDNEVNLSETVAVAVQSTMANIPSTIVKTSKTAIPTLEARPTYTFQPTFTLFPTQTAYPTATDYPTYTPLPTFTAQAIARRTVVSQINSATPAPSFTPLPTYTEMPTLKPRIVIKEITSTPQQTFTPYPTFTLFPTFTALPTYTEIPTHTPYPTFTTVPTQTAYPTYTPEPTKKPRTIYQIVTATIDPDPLKAPKNDGFYLVGKDIATGTWRVTDNPNLQKCYWKLTDRKNQIVKNFIGVSGGAFTIDDSILQLEIRNCDVLEYVGP